MVNRLERVILMFEHNITVRTEVDSEVRRQHKWRRTVGVETSSAAALARQRVSCSYPRSYGRKGGEPWQLQPSRNPRKPRKRTRRKPSIIVLPPPRFPGSLPSRHQRRSSARHSARSLAIGALHILICQDIRRQQARLLERAATFTRSAVVKVRVVQIAPGGRMPLCLELGSWVSGRSPAVWLLPRPAAVPIACDRNPCALTVSSATARSSASSTASGQPLGG